MDRVRTPLFAGPFRLLLLAHGFSSLAFFAFFGTVFAEATFDFGAGVTDLAIIGASLSVPFILGSLLQGLVADRWSPKWLSVLGYLGLASAVPVAWAASSPLWLSVSAFLVGGAFATIEPARSSLTALLVDKSELVRANGAMAVSFQLSLVLGSFGGGKLLEEFGAPVVYAAALGVAVIPVGLALGLPDLRQRGEQPGLSLDDLRAGARTAWRHPELRIVLLVTGLGWALVNTFFILEPLFVKQTLNRGGDVLLYLWAAHGLGALLGAAAVIRTKRATGRESALVCAGVAAVGTGTLLYAAVGDYGVALAAAGFMGVGFALFFPPLLALIQRVVSEEQRGRVTSAFVALQETMGLVSSLAILALGGLVVVRPTLVGSGVVLATMGLLGLRALSRIKQPGRRDDEPTNG